MKRIENPSSRKLSWLLIPIFLVLAFMTLMKAIPVWVVIVGIMSVAAYLSALTYHCIKQKCYGQLALNWIILFMWILIYMVQFSIVPRMLSRT